MTFVIVTLSIISLVLLVLTLVFSGLFLVAAYLLAKTDDELNEYKIKEFTNEMNENKIV